MSDPKSLATMDILRDFGFRPDDKIPFSDDSLSFDFGNFKLEASHVTSWWGTESVSFWGLLSTGRTISEISFEMPSEVESRDLCAAWIAFHIVSPALEPWWLIEGRLNENLLPWIIRQAAYEARPQCTVGRDWLRLGLKSLAAQVASVGNDTPVVLHFESGVLTIRCAGNVIALPGKGASWPQHVTIPAAELRRLPKRLTGNQISVSVWDSRLTIGRWSYEGIMDVSDSFRDQETSE